MPQPQRGPKAGLNVRGAVDLSSLAARRPAPSAAGAMGGAAPSGAVPAGVVVQITDETFKTGVLEQSMTVPVIIDFWAEWCEPCKQLTPILERLAVEFAGAFVLAAIDIDSNPVVAEAFKIQSIPAVFGVLKGQPIPLFQGAQPEAQIRAVLTEVLRVAKENGVTGTVQPGGAGTVQPDGEILEPELPPLHQEAYDAIEDGDFERAEGAYRRALAESPADDMARVGLAQVRLLRRTQDVDLAAARAAAAQRPDDIEAQLLVADLDVLGGHLEDAFARLVALVRITFGPDREGVRAHLVELFEVVGADDPRVGQARLKLANALF